MIKLLAMSLFIVVGAVIGFIFHRLVGNSKLPVHLCMALGVFGSFAGIWLADLADLHFIGNVIDGLLFASAGSILVLVLNSIIRRR